MNIAPVTAPVVSREIAPGVQVNSGMTGAEIFQAHLKANVQPAQSGGGRPVQPGSIAGKAPPPSPAALERQNAVSAPAPVAAAPAGEIDHAGIARLNARFKQVMQDLEPVAGKTVHGQKTVDSIRAQYNEELQEFHEGRRLGEKRADFQARRGSSGAPSSAAGAARFDPATGVISYVDGDGRITNTPAGMGAALDVATKATNKEGWAPASAITGPLLHGYSIPQDRTYQVAELVSGLRLARIGNLSQGQVSAIIANGWAKA